MDNHIKSLTIWNARLDPAEAEVWISLHPERLTSTTQVLGRIVGPRCVYSSTVEVAYPMREQRRQYEKEGDPGLTMRVIIPEPCLWDPQSPFIYQVNAELWESGKICQNVATSHSLYTLKLTPQGLRWNGRPVSLFGVARARFSEAEASKLRQTGYNTLLVETTADTAEACRLAARLGFFVLIRLTKREDIGAAPALREHGCVLGFVITGAFFREFPFAEAVPTWITRSDQMIGIEYDEDVADRLPTGFNFVLVKEEMLPRLAGVRMPRIIRRRGDRADSHESTSVDILGSIFTD
jgi:hypothetical protein